MKYRVINRDIAINFMRNEKCTSKDMLETLSEDVTTFATQMTDVRNYIYDKAIETGQAYCVYRNYKHYGTYKVNEAGKLIKTF